jgi:D-3-phosphoglycerate dehydrogenase
MKALVLAETKKNKLIQAFPSIHFDFEGYADNFIVLDHEKLISIIADYDILISEFDTIDKQVIDNASNLQLLICCRGGVKTVVDLEYAAYKGITVRNTPGRNSTAVAEYVIGQIISQDRFLNLSNDLVHSEQLQKEKFNKPAEYGDALWGMDATSPYHVFRGRGLQNITLGIVGYGRVGRTVSGMARALGMNVLVYDHSLLELTPEEKVVDFDKLLSSSDIVSLHCSNPKHETLFTKQVFNKMKPGSWFINTARGDLVDEDALLQALESGQLGKAILDVTRDEPLPLGSKLIEAPNLILTPHIAGATDVVIANVTKMVIAYLSEFLNNRGHNDEQ